MSTLALDLADGGLLGLTDGGAVLGPNPGCALVGGDGGAALFGEAALRRSRLQPRRVARGYWSSLGETPLGPPFPEGLRPADLAYEQLRGLWAMARPGVREVVLAVPGHYGQRQLGLVLGIAAAMDLPVVGLVDAALAAASAGFPEGQILHLDLGQDHALVTEIRQAEELSRERVAVIDRWGLGELRERQLRAAAAAFVHATRFDPLHDAATEQALFDRLPGLLETLAREERAVLAVPAPDRELSIELTRCEVEGWTARLADELVQQVSVLKTSGEPASVLVTPRAAALPGLLARLGEARGVVLALLPAQAAAAGALRQRDAVRSPEGGLRLALRLPRPSAPEGTVGGAAMLRPPSPPARRTAGPDSRRPTHVLLGSQARAITAEPLVIGTAPPATGRALVLEGETAGISRVHCRLVESAGQTLVEDLSTWGTYLNGEKVPARAVLAAGDRLRLGSPGVELLLIAAGED